ncbi:MAG: hypothetical protein QXY45_03910 [Candidatus Aenigmatarchaeota archaeon]
MYNYIESGSTGNQTHVRQRILADVIANYLGELLQPFFWKFYENLGLISLFDKGSDENSVEDDRHQRREPILRDPNEPRRIGYSLLGDVYNEINGVLEIISLLDYLRGGEGRAPYNILRPMRALQYLVNGIGAYRSRFEGGSKDPKINETILLLPLAGILLSSIGSSLVPQRKRNKKGNEGDKTKGERIIYNLRKYSAITVWGFGVALSMLPWYSISLIIDKYNDKCKRERLLDEARRRAQEVLSVV